MQLNLKQARDFAIFASGNALTTARLRVKQAKRARAYATRAPGDDAELATALAVLAEAEAIYASRRP
jgi:hypothetical protein